MDNTTSILHIWSNEIRSRNQRCVTVENRQVDLSREPEQSQVPKRNLDRVVEDAICVPRVVTEDRNPDRGRADRDHDRANRNRDRLARNHDRIVRDRGPGAVLDRAIVENRQVDPSRGGEQDRTLKRHARMTNRLADQSQAPEHVASRPDENRDPEVAPSPIIGIIIGANAIDRLPLSKSHERGRDPYHPDGDHAVVHGLCQSRQVVEVALGRELLPQIILMNKTSARNPKNPLKKRQRRQRKRMKRINMT